MGIAMNSTLMVPPKTMITPLRDQNIIRFPPWLSTRNTVAPQTTTPSTLPMRLALSIPRSASSEVPARNLWRPPDGGVA